MNTPYAFVARLEAKPEKAEAVAALLAGALPLAQAEAGHGRLVRRAHVRDDVLDLRHVRE